MKAQKRLVALLVVVAVGILLGVWLRRSGGSDGVRIGVLFPMTGEAGSYGEKGREAVQLALDDVNGAGGVHGKPVTAVFEDSRADPAAGVSAARKLIEVDHVVAIDGDIVSAVTLAVAPIAEARKVVLVAPTSSAPGITDAGEFVYRIWPSDLEEGRAIAQYAIRAGYTRAAILHMKNDYGQAIGDIFGRTFESQGGQVVLIDSYQESETDFRSALSKVASEASDVLYIAGYFADTASVARQARELGLKIQLMGTTAIEDDQFIILAGSAAEGVIYPLATGFDAADDDSTTATFVEAFRRRYSREPGWVEAHAYDAFKLLCYAAGRASQPVDGQKIKDVLDSMGSYKGVTGDIRFDRNGDVLKPVVIKTVSQGRFILLGD